MNLRFTAVLPLALAIVAALAATALGAMVGIYRNGMDTTAQRSQMVKLVGRSCERGGSQEALRFVVGKRTGECAFRTPVLGRDLEIAATERLLSGTPQAMQKKAFLGLALRAGGGSRYQLAVYPLQQKVQLRKVLSDGQIKYLQIVKEVSTVGGLNKANALRLSAINVAPGEARLLAKVRGKAVIDVTDPSAGELSGRASAVSAGAANNGVGVVASVDDVVIRVPSPF